MRSIIWRWEQMRKTIREKQRLSEPLNQAGDCALWGAVGDTAGVHALVPFGPITLHCQCHLQTAHSHPPLWRTALSGGSP